VRPAFDQAVAWARTTIGDSPAVHRRVIVGISALLYLRVSQLTCGQAPAGMDEPTFVRTVEDVFMTPSGSQAP
jgi:hypothetical protein